MAAVAGKATVLPPPPPAPVTETGLAVLVDDLALRGPEGDIVRGVTFAADGGDLVAVVGPGGSGRSSLLLALSGRMVVAGGTARLGGAMPMQLPADAAQVRDEIMVARITGAAEPDPRATVGELISEAGPLSSETISEAQVAEAFRLLGLAPSPKSRLDHLDPADQTLVLVGLVMAARPRAFVVDDVDRGADEAGLLRVWHGLRAAADTGITVFASTTWEPTPSEFPDVFVRLGAASGPVPAGAETLVLEQRS